jgi:hypothetical protein
LRRHHATAQTQLARQHEYHVTHLQGEINGISAEIEATGPRVLIRPKSVSHVWKKYEWWAVLLPLDRV